MKLTLPFGKNNKKEFFLALVLRNEKINAVFFEESEGKVHVLAKHSEKFEHSIEEATENELLSTADKAISQAEQSLPEKLETVKTIFGVKGSWVEENKIKKDYLAKLKKISDELGLIPIGFLVIFEAIAYLLEKEEGAPVTTILVEIGEKFVSAGLIKAGKIKEFKTSEIVESPAKTLDNILKHFTSADVLPQRIIILSGDEDESQEFINHTWSKSIPFIHLPQVTTLPSEFDARAILSGAAAQLGFEVLDETIPDEEISDSEIQKVELEEDENLDDKTKIIGDDKSIEHFSFIKDADIVKMSITKSKDEGKGKKIDVEETPVGASPDVIEEIPEEVKEEITGKELPANAFAILQGAKSVIPKLIKSFGKLPVKNLASIVPGLTSRGKLLIIPAVLIIIFVILLFFYFFSNKATVLLDINAKSSEKTQDVTFAGDSPTDPSGGVLASQFLAVTEGATISTKATGKKEVGDKAKGIVTIFNNDSSPKTLTSGTTITSQNDLEFTLDKNVTIASASGDIFSGTTPGKEKVSVTAGKIGQEYNLPSNTKFTIGGSSSIAAKNDDAFSGGTKKEVTVVSESDIKKLEEELPKSLEQKAREDLRRKISHDEVLLPVLISSELVKKDFSKKEDEEADQVKLDGTVQYKGLSYKKSDAVDFAKEILKNEISEDEIIDPSSVSVEVKEIKNDGDKVTAEVAVKGFIIPKIDEASVAKQISGKSFQSAQEILTKLPQVSNSQINLSFDLPLLPKRLPFSSENIKISTKINE